LPVAGEKVLGSLRRFPADRRRGHPRTAST
jgi:hypothetical protein